MKVLQGVVAATGLAMGSVYYYQKRSRVNGSKSRFGPEKEWALFLKAREEAQAQLQALREKVTSSDVADVLETHILLAEDEDFADAVAQQINENGARADYAVQEASHEIAAIFATMDDSYMQARADDIKDVADRIIGALSKVQKAQVGIQDHSVIVSDDIAPSELISLITFHKDKIVAFVTSQGTTTGHMAILARSLGVPAVVQVGDDLTLYQGNLAIVDGETGKVYFQPEDAVARSYRLKIEEARQKTLSYRLVYGVPTQTQGGRSIRLYCNIASPEEVKAVVANDGEGIGLYRSEFLFLGRDDLPTEEEQYEAYASALDEMQGKEVIIRTCDIGTDKKSPCFDLPQEENPALGLRAIRISMGLGAQAFRTQLRALYRASVHGNLGIMFPMIANEWEVDACKVLCANIQNELRMEGIAFSEETKIGIMIETPAAALLSAELAQKVDFFSCGTNDLTQYTLACDRQNAGLERFYDAHHPALLKLLAMTVENAHKHGIPVGICGELGADEAMLDKFLDLGFDELSVQPNAVLKLRSKIVQMPR